jgi:hypothetical protein
MEAALTSVLTVDIRLITRKRIRETVTFTLQFSPHLNSLFPADALSYYCHTFAFPALRTESSWTYVYSSWKAACQSEKCEWMDYIFKNDLLSKRFTDGRIKCETEDNGDNLNIYCIRSVTISLSMLVLNCRLIAQDWQQRIELRTVALWGC